MSQNENQPNGYAPLNSAGQQMTATAAAISQCDRKHQRLVCGEQAFLRPMAKEKEEESTELTRLPDQSESNAMQTKQQQVSDLISVIGNHAASEDEWVPACHLLAEYQLQPKKRFQLAPIFIVIGMLLIVGISYESVRHTIVTFQSQSAARALCEEGEERLRSSALAYYKQGEERAYKSKQEAIILFDKALALEPHFAQAYADRGLAYDRLNKHQEAVNDYTAAMALEPSISLYPKHSEDTPVCLYRGDDYRVNLHQYQKAVADYSQAISINPQLKIAYNGRADAYKALGQYDKCIDDYTTLITMASNQSRHLFWDNYRNQDTVWSLITLYNLRSQTYAELERHENTIEDCTHAIELAETMNKRLIREIEIVHTKTGDQVKCTPMDAKNWTLETFYGRRADAFAAIGKVRLAEDDRTHGAMFAKGGEPLLK